MKSTKGRTDFQYKLFVFIMFAEGEVDYVRRQDLRFSVHIPPLKVRFNRNTERLMVAFRGLEDSGLIYNLVKEAASVKFHLRVPCYLSLSSEAYKTEKLVSGRGFYGE